MTTAPANDTPATIKGFNVLAGLDQLTPTPTPSDDDQRTRRFRTRRAEKRTDREHDLHLAAQRNQLRRADKTARRTQRRQDQAAARAARAETRAQRRAQHAERDARIKTTTLAAARHFMVIGPITAPMAVAWSSQTSYAMTAFNWHLIFALGFAAAWELSTTFTGWMYHQARKHGDRGLEYRLLTWVFALGAAGMNYAHHCGPAGAPTQAAVAFATMSITGMILWESYARLVHRQYLRQEGKVPAARPRLGIARWVRYPVHAWTAWSLTIRSADHDTADKAWTAADRLLADRRAQRTADRADRTALRTGLTVHRVVLPAVRTADHGPSAIPTVRTATVTLDRTDRPRTAAPAGRSAAGPCVDRTATALPAGPDRTAHEPTATDRTERTADRENADRPGGPRRTGPAERTANTTDRTGGGPDRTEDLALTTLEQKAIDTLRTTDRSISKRSIQDVVRRELGGSIASDRAVQIARHFRTLRSAA